MIDDQLFTESPFAGFSDETGMEEDSFARAYAGYRARTQAQPSMYSVDPQSGLPDLGPSESFLPDPMGFAAVDYGRQVNKPVNRYAPLYVNVPGYGKVSRETLMKSGDVGYRILHHADNEAKGASRGFWSALTDISFNDLPFVGMVAEVGGSVSTAVEVSDIMRKKMAGETLTFDEACKLQLYRMEQGWKETGGVGAMIGDVVRHAPGFMAEFFASGGVFSAVRTGLSKMAGKSSTLAFTRATKVLTSEAMEAFAQEEAKQLAGKTAAEAFKELANTGARKAIIDKTAAQVVKATMLDNPMYKGLSKEVLTDMATARAEAEFGKMMARHTSSSTWNSLVKAGQWAKSHVSRGLMDFGSWGTEESTILFTQRSGAGRALADALGTFTLEAIPKGIELYGANAAAQVGIGYLAGTGGRTVSDAQLALQSQALNSNRPDLMAQAESIALGQNLLEYISENTGRGFKSLMRAGGLGLERLGAKGLTAQATRAVTDTGDALFPESGQAAFTIGTKMRQAVEKYFGSRRDTVRNLAQTRATAVAARLSKTMELTAADHAALDTAVRSGSAAGLRVELQAAVGENFGRYVEDSVKEAYAEGVKQLQYRTLAKYRIARYMAKHQIGPETVMNMFDRMGYDGVFGEMFEERYSDFAKGLCGFDDRAADEKTFLQNLKKGIHDAIMPGWDQIVAEAVGFSIPGVVRSGMLRLHSAVGGGGKMMEMREKIEALNDASRHDTAERMRLGDYLKEHEDMLRSYDEEIANLGRRKSELGTAGQKEEAESARREIDRLRKIRERRVERHEMFMKSLPEQARADAASITAVPTLADAALSPQARAEAMKKYAVPILDDAVLADDELYSRAPEITARQAEDTLAGQEGIVDYSPELAELLYRSDAVLEGEKPSWYRRAAHKILGIAEAFTTGNLSAVFENDYSWSAADYGLSSHLLKSLREGMRRQVDETRRTMSSRVTDVRELDAKIENLRSRRTRTAEEDAMLADFEAQRSRAGESRDFTEDEVVSQAGRDFAAKARQMMSAYLSVHQLRSFSDGRVRDQAVAHVATQMGYLRHLDESGNVAFTKFDEDKGTPDVSTTMSAAAFADAHRAEVDDAASKITRATYRLMSRHLTKSRTADSRVINTMRLPADSDLKSAAIYDSAMHMIGMDNVVAVQEIDRNVPLSEALKRRSVGTLRKGVLRYIAENGESADERALESVAYALRLPFDGTEEGLKARNAKIRKIAALAAMAGNPRGSVVFGRETEDSDFNHRVNPSAMATLVAEPKDGKYVIDFGFVTDTGLRDIREYATREALVEAMRANGYSEVEGDLVISLAKVVESEDMFDMIRDLGLGQEYYSLMKNKARHQTHPMFRQLERHDAFVPENTARAQLRKEMALAAMWNDESQTLNPGAPANMEEAAQKAWENLWGADGYMTLGEKLLEQHGVVKDGLTAVTGETREYAPVKYTLALNAGRIGKGSADTIVTVDPLVNPDVTSGLVNAILMDAYARHPRLLRDSLPGVISDFAHDLKTVIEDARTDAEKAGNTELVESLDFLDSTCCRNVDREVLVDGQFELRKGTGLTPFGFAVMAQSFVLYREHAWKGNPLLMGVAAVADKVRNFPSFLGFTNVVDLALGGSGMLQAAVRDAAGEQAPQTGVRRLMSIIEADDKAMENSVRLAAPGGLTWRQFVDGCIRQLDAVRPRAAMSDKDRTALRGKADAADATRGANGKFNLLGDLISVIKRTIVDDASSQIGSATLKFFQDAVAAAIANDTAGTISEKQKNAVRTLLNLAERRVSRQQTEEAAVVSSNEAQSLRQELEAAREKVRELQAALNAKTGTSEDTTAEAVQVEQARAAAAELEKRAEDAARAAAEARKRVPGSLDAQLFQVQSAARAGEAQEFVKKVQEQNLSESAGQEEQSFEDEGDEDDLSVRAVDDGREVPLVFAEQAGMSQSAFLSRYGVVEGESAPLSRRQIRVALSVAIRLSLAGDLSDVTEGSAVESALRLFPHLTSREVELLRQAFRFADAARQRTGESWASAFKESDGAWDFMRDVREDDDTSSDDFNRTAVNEYSSERMEDFLALAQKCSPMSGRNLQAFFRIVRDDATRLASSRAGQLLDRVANPLMDMRGSTEAECDALYEADTIPKFDGYGVRAEITQLLGKDGSRPGAFLLAYMSSLPLNARLRFGRLAGKSLAANPIGVRGTTLTTRRNRATSRVSRSAVVDSFLALRGMDGSALKDLAAQVSAVKSRLGNTVAADLTVRNPKPADLASAVVDGMKRIAEEFAPVLGSGSSLVMALRSAVLHREIEALAKSPESTPTLRSLAEAFTVHATARGQRVGLAHEAPKVVESLAAGISQFSQVVGEGRATYDQIAREFTALLATGPASGTSLRAAPAHLGATDALMTVLNYFTDATPDTIMNADVVDSTKPRASVVVAPRNLVPLVSRWLFSKDEDAIVTTDGKGAETKHPTFAQILAERFDVTDEKEVRRCIQTATWPDGTAIVAKNLSAHLTALQLLDFCRETFRTSPAEPVYVPVYAGDHSSYIVLQVPRKAVWGTAEMETAATVYDKKADKAVYDNIYDAIAKEVATSVGISLMAGKGAAKRSALSSAEAVAVGLVGVDLSDPAAPKYGEHRVHILRNFRGEADGLMKEAFKGSVFMRGYGAEAMRRTAPDPTSPTIKAHLMSSSGRDLFFIKALVASTAEGEQYLEGTANRVLEDYLNGYRGSADRLSTDTLTDYDSYKVGVAGSSAIRARTADGELATVMDVVFDRIAGKVRAGEKFSKLTGDELDALVGDIEIVDSVRGPAGSGPRKLSEILPGATLNTLDGLSGLASVDLSYAENGAMGYTVANVSHGARNSNEPGRSPRNYEVDALAMARTLAGMDPANAELAARVTSLVSGWGLVAGSVYSDPAVQASLRRESESIVAALRSGENEDGQNIRAELAYLVAARTRQMMNLPLAGIDMPLVSSGCQIDADGKVHSMSASGMMEDLMQGSRLFTEAERGFYGCVRRLGICNVNSRDAFFRYGWWLNDEEFDKAYPGLDAQGKARKLADLFESIRRAERESDAATALANRQYVMRFFMDHHGRPVLEALGERKAAKVSFDDLFVEGSFDLSAVQTGADGVRNDATGKRHTFLGGTLVGFPRTPSYNGSMWLQTVRAGIPVTEEEIRDKETDEVVGWRPGRNAMVQPDPQTNAILGSDHDGDKAKIYLLHPDADGKVRDTSLPEPAKLPEGAYTRSEFRRDYLAQLAAAGFLEAVHQDPETGETVRVKDDGYAGDDAFLQITADARRHVSNAFVSELFRMSRRLPTATDQDIDAGRAADARASQPGQPRLPFLGGIASSPTKTRPVKDGKSLDAHMDRPTIGPNDTFGDPVPAARAQTSALDASDARARIVGLASTLHLAYSSGAFESGNRLESLFPSSVRPSDWLRFMYRVDGISNATFDDLKEQICSRLGWTSGMMDTVVEEIILNSAAGGRLPVTDADFLESLGAYSDDVRRQGRFYQMLLSSSEAESGERSLMLDGMTGSKVASKSNICTAFGIEGSGTKSDRYRTGQKNSDSAAMMRGLAKAFLDLKASPEGRGMKTDLGDFLREVVNGMTRFNGVNPVVGYMYWLTEKFGVAAKNNGIQVTPAKDGFEDKVAKSEEAKTFVRWVLKRKALAQAQSFAKSVNYLKIDVNAPGAATQRKGAERTFADVELPANAAPAYRRMNLAAMLAYDVGDGLATIVNAAADAADTRNATIAELLSLRNESVNPLLAKLMYRRGLTRYSRMQLEAQRQQVPYVVGLLRATPQLAAFVKDTPWTTARSLYDALKTVATGAAAGFSNYQTSIVGNEGIKATPDGIALRAGIESMIDVMASLASTSDEYRNGRNLTFAGLRSTHDTAYSRDDGSPGYGVLAGSLRRIASLYRSDDESQAEAVRADMEKVISGEAFGGKRESKFAVADTFALTRESLEAWLREITGMNADVKSMLAKLQSMNAGFARTFATAYGAVAALDVPVTPAMMVGQLLPMYSVLTSRVLGAPSAKSPSMLGMLPNRYYSAMSAAEVELRGPLMDILGTTDLAPWRGPERGKAFRLGSVPEAALATAEEIGENPSAQDRAKAVAAERKKAADLEASRQAWRGNPEARNTLDILSDDLFGSVVDCLEAGWGGRVSAESDRALTSAIARAETGSQETIPLEDPVYDAGTAAVARALGALLGSWATVKYTGGYTFTIEGRLSGNAGEGKKVLLTVDTSGQGGAIESDEQVEALADSTAYAQSFAMQSGMGIDARSFLTLPKAVRMALVRKFGVGGAASSVIDVTIDGRGLATLAGHIMLNGTKNSTKMYHEYFHAMMRVFEKAGLFGEEDYKALRERFGESVRSDRKFNEENAAEAFREWVEDHTDEDTSVIGRVFRKIYDFVRGLLEALCRGYEWKDVSVDTLFKMTVSGVAQSTTSRLAERSTLPSARNKAWAKKLEAAEAKGDDVAVASLMRKAFLMRATPARDPNAPAPAAPTLPDLVSTPAFVSYVADDVKAAVASQADAVVRAADPKNGTDSKVLKGMVQQLSQLVWDAAANVPEDEVPEALRVLSQTGSADYGLEDAWRSEDAITRYEARMRRAEEDMLDMEERQYAALERAMHRADAQGGDAAEPASEALHEEAEAAKDILSFAPRTERNEFYMAARLIRESVEKGLRTEGSWRNGLEYVAKKYSGRSAHPGMDELRDHAIIANGIRRALWELNPAEARRVSDSDITGSLAFHAALAMYHASEGSFMTPVGADGRPRPPSASPVELRTSSAAKAFAVSSWILSSSPAAPGDVIARAKKRVEALHARATSDAVRAELRFHLDMIAKLETLGGDPSGLQWSRNDEASRVMSEVVAPLEAGTEFHGVHPNGTPQDFTPAAPTPVDPSRKEDKSDAAANHLRTFAATYTVKAVQQSLKATLACAYQIAGMVKWRQELGIVPAQMEDFEFQDRYARRSNRPDHVTAAEWAATQNIGDSNLVNRNLGLVDYYNQSYFIADNVDSWLRSMTCKSFGSPDGIGEMLAAEQREYASVKREIADLENHYAFLYGMNAETGGSPLRLQTQEGEYAWEAGAIVRKVGGRYVKFDNYHRDYCGFTLDEDDLRVIDLYHKAAGARAMDYDRLVTGATRMRFNISMLAHDRDWYSEENVRLRVERKVEEKPDELDNKLYLLAQQLPDSVIHGRVNLRNRILDAVFEAFEEAKRVEVEPDVAYSKASHTLNSYVIAYLARKGLMVGFNREHRRDARNYKLYTMGAFTVPVADVVDCFRNSAAYSKLTSEEGGRILTDGAGNKTDLLDFDRMVSDYMAVYRKAWRFVKRHPWLTHGDGRYFHTFGTKLPFWRGSGVFMYNAVRADRDRLTEEAETLPERERSFLDMVRGEHGLEVFADGSYEGAQAMTDYLADLCGWKEGGRALFDAIARGGFAEGTENSEKYGVSIPADARRADVGRAIYDKLVERVFDAKTTASGPAFDAAAAEKLISLYEDGRLEAGEPFGGALGMTPGQLFEAHGVLPANFQIGKHVHMAIDGLTNAMMAKATFANLLMTPAADGRPVYYADPSKLAANAMMPDSFWQTLGRWWAETSGLEYDDAATGIANAKRIYAAIREMHVGKGEGKVGGAKYEEMTGANTDCASVERWLVREEPRTEDETLLNGLAGGEAKGYLQHYLHASRVLGFGGPATRAVLHRALSWSKSMSVSFSFFFPIATKWESPTAAVGAMATLMSNNKWGSGEFLRNNPKAANVLNAMFGGGYGWITKDFIGFSDIMRMMDSNDPFLAEMYAWAESLGLTFSSNLVNPMEPQRGVLRSDIARMKAYVHRSMGARAAAKFARIMDTVVLRQGDKAFNYAMNATKLAVAAQMMMKLRHEAAARGKAFDPVRDLRRYSRYINAEVGGIDPLQMAWATPRNRGIMNLLMFSWQWTLGAWRAGGGGVLEDALLGGHTTSRREREMLLGRWTRMYMAVMIGVPALIQAVSTGLAKLLWAFFPPDDDREKEDARWFTWQNETKTRWSAADITPLMRAISRMDESLLGGILRKAKVKGGMYAGLAGAAAGAWRGASGGNWLTGLVGSALGSALGSQVPALIPMYTGSDAANVTKLRRYYLHFGKQGWEFYRWFDHAGQQFFSKLSMPVQRLLESVIGRNMSYLDRALPWEGKGQVERWFDFTPQGAPFNIALAFLPFTVSGLGRTGDAGVFQMGGVVQMGAAGTSSRKAMESRISAMAMNDRSGYSWGANGPYVAKASMRRRCGDILEDLRRNGYDADKVYTYALSNVKSDIMGKLINAFPDDPGGPFDEHEIRRLARAANRVGAEALAAQEKLVSTYMDQGGRWMRGFTPEQRRLFLRVMGQAALNPYRPVAALHESPETPRTFDY